ncbi:hypothetical protein, partial [Salinivirga cyanobacteriivorans]
WLVEIEMVMLRSYCRLARSGVKFILILQRDWQRASGGLAKMFYKSTYEKSTHTYKKSPRFRRL